MKLLMTLLLLFLSGLTLKAQIGLTPKEILKSDSLYTETKDLISSNNCIICKFNNNLAVGLKSPTLVVFNFKDNICLSTTVYSDRDSEAYMRIIQIYTEYSQDCNSISWNSELKYLSNNTLVYTMYTVCKIRKDD